jgi:hypothetical protein
MGLSNELFLSGFATKFMYKFLIYICLWVLPTLPVEFSSFCLEFSNSSAVYLRTIIMRFFLTQFSPSSCYLHSLGSKYSPQHFVLKHSICFIPPGSLPPSTYFNVIYPVAVISPLILIKEEWEGSRVIQMQKGRPSCHVDRNVNKTQ